MTSAAKAAGTQKAAPRRIASGEETACGVVVCSPVHRWLDFDLCADCFQFDLC